MMGILINSLHLQPDRMSESPSIPPAAVLAAAAVSLSPPSAPTAATAVTVPTSHPTLPLPIPFLPSLIPPQPSPAASAAAIHAVATAHAARTNRTLANLVATSQPSITVAAPTMPTSHSDAMMQKIFDGRYKAQHVSYFLLYFTLVNGNGPGTLGFQLTYMTSVRNVRIFRCMRCSGIT